MSPVNLNDLPAAVRQRIAEQEGHATTARTRQADSERGPAYRCATPGCPAVWPVWSEAGSKHHLRETGHGRFAAVLS